MRALLVRDSCLLRGAAFEFSKKWWFQLETNAVQIFNMHKMEKIIVAAKMVENA